MATVIGMDTYEGFLKLLAGALEKRGKSQSWLAKEVGMSEAWVSRVLSGDIDVSVRQMLDVAEKLSVAPASLLPVVPIPEDGHGEPISFEEFIQKVVAQEIEKRLNKAVEDELKRRFST